MDFGCLVDTHTLSFSLPLRNAEVSGGNAPASFAAQPAMMPARSGQQPQALTTLDGYEVAWNDVPINDPYAVPVDDSEAGDHRYDLPLSGTPPAGGSQAQGGDYHSLPVGRVCPANPAAGGSPGYAPALTAPPPAPGIRRNNPHRKPSLYDGFGDSVKAEAQTGAVTSDADLVPPWLQMKISSRAEAEALLRRQPAAGDSLVYLVRARRGQERSWALSYLVGGSMSHVLVEQPRAGGGFTVNQVPGHLGTRLEEVIPKALAGICAEKRCTLSPARAGSPVQSR